MLVLLKKQKSVGAVKNKTTKKKQQKAAEEDEEETQEVAVGPAVAKEISLDAALVAATITIGYQFHIKRRTKRDTKTFHRGMDFCASLHSGSDKNFICCVTAVHRG